MIYVGHLAGHGAAPKSVTEEQGGLLTAAPLLAVTTLAALTALWGVNAVQSDSFATDLYRVAIDNAGGAYDGLRGGEAAGSDEERHGGEDAEHSEFRFVAKGDREGSASKSCA